jgi:hypothetical protein
MSDAALTTRISEAYKRHFRDRPRERLFLSSLSFFITFAIARTVAYSIHEGRHVFPTVYVEGTHVHHLVFGIVLLLMVGYACLAHAESLTSWQSRWAAILYGIGAALTLDEFALWLNLRDVYWAREGRESIDAVILFGSLLLIGLWGGPFLSALVREVGRFFRGRK